MDKPSIENNFSSFLKLFMVFSCVAVLLSSWLGLFWRNSIIIFAASAIISFFLLKRFPFELRLSKKIILLAVLLFILEIYPLLLLTPFYPGSTDYLHVISLRVITDRIPQTYEPYSPVYLNYQLGFHLFAKIFSDIMPFINDYLVLWLLGAVFASLQLIFLFLLSRELLKSDYAGMLSAAIFFGTRFVFQNMYYGMYPWLMATTFFLLFALLFIRKNWLSYLFLPAIFTIHPGVAFYSCIFLFVFVLFNRDCLKNALFLLLSLILALPSYLITYEARLSMLFSGSSTVLVKTAPELLQTLILPFMWSGILPTCLFAFSALLAAKKFFESRRFDDGEAMLLFLVVCSYFAYLFFALFKRSTALSDKTAELFCLSIILFSTHYLVSSGIQFFKSKKLLAFVLCISILLFFSSSYLQGLREGTKITKEEAEFALLMKEKIPERSKVLFLSKGLAGMAMLSDSLPFNPLHGWFISRSSENLHPAEFAFELEKEKQWEKIVNEGCTKCIYSLNVDYVVISRSFFPHILEADLIFSYKDFSLYKLK